MDWQGGRQQPAAPFSQPAIFIAGEDGAVRFYHLANATLNRYPVSRFFIKPFTKRRNAGKRH